MGADHFIFGTDAPPLKPLVAGLDGDGTPEEFVEEDTAFTSPADLKAAHSQLDSGDEKEEALAKRGLFFIQHDIDDCSAYAFCHEALGSKMSGCFKDRPMTVVLNTPGGDVEHGLAIYDTIRMLVASGTEVHVVGLGRVASMGTVIMQAGSRRIASRLTDSGVLIRALPWQCGQSTMVGALSFQPVRRLRPRVWECRLLGSGICPPGNHRHRRRGF